MNLHAFDKLIRDAHEKMVKNSQTSKCISRIAKEVVSHSKSLPLDLIQYLLQIQFGKYENSMNLSLLVQPEHHMILAVFTSGCIVRQLS